ncbi:hypothetical protein PG999_009782 [Apiospora kogelbergensis]|uniref:Uncharacterized protein n=1 Tax=Apiospora kogelbergensis TaxID=1337665 RepID=A0AAW0QPE9_9PEZI
MLFSTVDQHGQLISYGLFPPRAPPPPSPPLPSWCNEAEEICAKNEDKEDEANESGVIVATAGVITIIVVVVIFVVLYQGDGAGH